MAALAQPRGRIEHAELYDWALQAPFPTIFMII